MNGGAAKNGKVKPVAKKSQVENSRYISQKGEKDVWGGRKTQEKWGSPS